MKWSEKFGTAPAREMFTEARTFEFSDTDREARFRRFEGNLRRELARGTETVSPDDAVELGLADEDIPILFQRYKPDLVSCMEAGFGDDDWELGTPSGIEPKTCEACE